MNEKFYDKYQKVKAWWKKGKLQKFSRITSDVIWNVILIFIIIGLVGGFFLGGIGAGYFASLVKDEPIRAYDDMKQSIYNYEETTELYFADNQYLGKLSADLHRDEVSISDISQYVIDAVIATEDEYFNEHNGVVPKAILRALLQEFLNSANKTGGSTLTQQLIKNQILTNEVSFERKAKEILLAMRLEEFFKKEEILEAYLNVVPFGRDSSGRNVAGIQTAAQGVFGVDAKDLNLPQAAYLAGMPQSPFGYTPFTNGGEQKSAEGLQPGLDRMKIVLSRMLEVGDITETEYNEALNYDITADFIEPQPSPIEKYPLLTVEIEKRAREIMALQLAKQDGYTEEDLENNDDLAEEYNIIAKRNLRQKGYKINTTIDREVYDEFQRIAKEFEHYTPTHTIIRENPETGVKEKVENPVHPGSILIENKTGKIIAFVGGRDFALSENNHATTTIRPNGSTMKPILDYAPAMEKGIVQPATVLPDVKNSGPNTGANWLPDNYTSTESGLTTVRTALAKSLNIPAARVYKEILPDRPTTYLEKMGFTTLYEDENTSDHENPSMSIGSLSKGVSVEENTNAYVTFGNMGKFVDAYMIESIETKDGEVIFQHESEMVDVFTPQTAYLTIDLMRDVLSAGTATYARSVLNHPGVDWAGKTGSTENIQDTWFVATNPNVTIGSWMGYDTYDYEGDGGGSSAADRRIHLNYNYGTNLGYSSRNVLLWARLVNAATELRPDLMLPESGFQSPGGLVRRSVCSVSGLLPSEACEEAGLITTDIFNAKFAPKEEDYSLIKDNIVKIEDKYYPAIEGKTPEEFTEEGFLLNPEFLKDRGWDKVHDLSKLLPKGEKWEKIMIPDTEELEDDGKAPSAPSNVTLSGNKLTWTKPAEKDVIGYRIYMADEPEKEAETVGNTKETEFELPSKNKAFYVTAVDIYGEESEYSKVAVFGEIITKPGAVADLKASAEETSVKLTWSNPADDDFSHVMILRGSNVIAESVSGTSYTDNDGLKPDTSYTYTVIAVDEDGEQSDRRNVKVTTKGEAVEVDKQPPGEVTELKATIDKKKATISFKIPNDDDFLKVIIQGDLQAEKNTGPIVFNGLQPGDYTILVRTVDSAGNRSPGKTLEFTISETTDTPTE
ncbi:penicillin-binding protein [Salirhabdus euzebyi]|uniref:Penicillin-binding protein n=1 Tax=Salirhabdus euzebyi TaxID=394506 RepID=A0A841Q1J7_9BACI|nr:transglycosylase domain-containing protein [Salirhabdus euzebyi]MBB6452133.1 penicillin-binding protein [Salirhabdus euzebyi]